MEELVVTPHASAGARKLYWSGALFLAVLLATTLTDQIAPLGAPRLVGVERARHKDLVSSARFSDGSLARLAEKRLRLNSRVRRRVAPFWIGFVARYLKSATEDVVMGRDGWLFLRDRAVVSPRKAELSIVLVRRLCLAMDRRLSSEGTALVLIPVPHKTSAAEAFLPEGFPKLQAFGGALDTALIHGLREDGARVVDAEQAWSKLPSGAAYLPLDTHWSDLGQRTLAAEVARLFPSPTEARDLDLTVERRTEPARAALLSLIGVGEHYRAGALFPKGQVERVILAPEDVPEAGRSPWAVLAGTSFTAEFDFHAHLSVATQSRIGKVAVAATPFGTTLAFAISQYASRPLPSTIFFEFPAHEIFNVGGGQQRVQLGLTQVFALRPMRRATPLVWPHPSLPPEPAQPQARPLGRLRYRNGELLSSGDGVLSIRIDIENDEPSRWELQLKGIAFTWKAPPGSSQIYLPIVEGEELGRTVELVPLDASARRATASITPVLDADLDSARPWTGSASVAREDVALVQWEPLGPRQPVGIRLTGRTPENEDTEVHWTFRDAGTGGAVLSLTRFRGGFLDSVSVTGPGGAALPTTVRIAPAPRPR